MLKRLSDILFSLSGLVLVSPFLVTIALWVKGEDGGPIFYRGVRVGRYGKPFRIFKFRTMVINAEEIGGPSTADDDPRITWIGKLIRKYKLDEVPQLINVLIGIDPDEILRKRPSGIIMSKPRGKHYMGQGIYAPVKYAHLPLCEVRAGMPGHQLNRLLFFPR